MVIAVLGIRVLLPLEGGYQPQFTSKNMETIKAARSQTQKVQNLFFN
jgi:hypothetical protein